MKIVVIILAFAGTMLSQWYGNFSGKLPVKGSFLGFAYDSVFVRAFVTQLEYIWVLILINVCFTLLFQLGFQAFKDSFLSLSIIWLAMGPISALIFTTLVLKEKVNFVAIAGLLLVVIGSVLVIAQKEILQLIKKYL
ncbi:hypothetical protein HZA42_00740 [Candidatus Peregrinibacteria bacterium]|nr:hypothetical protein [Candidatus Peregrinibacteria bacterium]